MTSPLIFDVQAKTSSAVAGFKRLASSISPVTKQADAASRSMDKLASTKVAPKADATAITKIKNEIDKLLDEISEAKALDVHADTRKAQAKIRGLQSTLRTLAKAPIDPQVKTGWRNKITSALSSVQSGLGKIGSGFASVFSSVGVPLIGALGKAAVGLGVGLGAVAVKSLELADGMERAKVQMTSFTKNAKVTDKLLADLQKYADTTPFEFPELQSAAKRLLGVGTAAKDIPKQLALIGDVAAQSGASVDDLSLIFSQMVSNGRVSAEDMNQLADRGVNAWGALSEATGKSVSDLRKLGEEGKLGAKDIRALWDELGKGAEGATGALSKTLSGQISTLKDTATGILRDIGDALLPIAKQIVPQIQKGTEGLGVKIGAALPGWINALLEGAKGLIDMGGTLLVGLRDITTGVLSAVGDFQRGLGQMVTAFAKSGLAEALGIDTEALGKAGEDLVAAGDATKLEVGKIGIQWNKWIENYNKGASKAKSAISATQIKSAFTFSIAEATDNVAKIKARLADLKKQKPTAKVKAKIDEAEASLKKAESKLKFLDRYTANPKLLAKDLASGKVAIVNGKLKRMPDKSVKITAQDKTKSGVDSANRTTAGAKDRTVTITSVFVNKKRTAAGKGETVGERSVSVAPSSTTVVAAPAVTVTPQITLHVRDERLADLIDIRVDGRAAHAARIVGRRRAVRL